MMSTNIFYKLPANMSQVDNQYDVVAGHWPENYDEVVAVLTPNGNVSDFMLYSMGLRDHKELEEMVREFANEEEVQVPDNTLDLDYDDLMNVEFKLVNGADFYQYDSDYQVWKDKSGDADYMKSLVDHGETLKVCGVVKPKEGEKITSLSTGLYYSNDLINHLIDEASDKQIVKDQQADPATNVITGKSFAEEEDEAKDGNGFDMSSLFTIDSEKLQGAFTFDESALAAGLSNADLSSSMDLSGASIDLSSMPAFDASGIQIDPSKIDMSQLNLDFSNIKLNLDGAQPDIKTDVLTQGVMNIMAAYPSWLQEQIKGDHPEYATDQKAAVEAYLTDPATKAAMQKGYCRQHRFQRRERTNPTAAARAAFTATTSAASTRTFCSYFRSSCKRSFRRYAVVYANSNDAGHDTIWNSNPKPSLLRDGHLHVHPFGKYVKSHGH